VTDPGLTQGSPVAAARPPLLTPAMLGIAAGAILVPLNSTMLAVALPSVMTTFAVRPDEVASLVTMYLGAVTVALPASGSIGDRFGHRRTMLVSLVVFAAGAAVAGCARRRKRFAQRRIGRSKNLADR